MIVAAGVARASNLPLPKASAAMLIRRSFFAYGQATNKANMQNIRATMRLNSRSNNNLLNSKSGIGPMVRTMTAVPYLFPENECPGRPLTKISPLSKAERPDSSNCVDGIGAIDSGKAKWDCMVFIDASQSSTETRFSSASITWKNPLVISAQKIPCWRSKLLVTICQ
jgi:hypothetical protein